MPQLGYSYRPVALGREGMVAAAHPLATLAGIEVLKSGGTVADAAVAVNAVLAVTQPNNCGVGGDLFCLFYEAASRRVHFLNGAGRSGSRATLEELGRRGMTGLPILGPAAVSVPGCVRAWAMLLERFGTRPLPELLQPAIRCAERGFPMTSIVSQSIAELAPVNPDAEWHRVFQPGGRPPALGEPFVQADLARTLRDLAAEGPDLFYTGRVGQAIARRLAADGFLTPEDLAAHTGEWAEPIAATYRGRTVWQTPPPTQGLAALLVLNVLEGFPLAKLPLHSVEHLHLLIEAVKLAYADRDRWIGDPAHARVPVPSLLDKEYAALRRRAFDPGKAGSYRWGEPEGDTTGFVVADGAGNMIAVIQSLFNAYGSGVVVPGAGVVLQNRGRHFWTDPAHPSALAPGKRPFHTLMAAIVTENDRPFLGFATMGGNGQAMFHAQVLTNVLDYGLDIQEAIERPRFLIGAFLPGEPADTINVEGRVPARVLAGLRKRGHHVKAAPARFYKVGHAHGVVVSDGTLMGGADPRGDGLALGF
ncbi:MAG: gamma-glutamyltransferase [Candidatus Rokubacteria bacterium]|nr:gamma-glutamyltransferase [Candidatus Rokubacteria bacterium]